MAKTLGDVVNAGLKAMGEPEISSFTSGSILESRLIEQANNAVRKIMAKHPFEWGLKRTTLTTTDDITTGNSAVTNGSDTVTSVDSAGNDADDFTGATTSMWWRRTGDSTSYEVTVVDTASSPDALTISPEYVGDTTTASGYRLFQDTYSLTDSDLDEVRFLTYGEAPLSSVGKRDQIQLVNLSDILYQAGGDLHRDTSGRPRMAARISVDASDQPRLVLWPFPTDEYVIGVWYTIKYSENSTFGTNLFNGDAPEIAYDAVEHYVCHAAYRWDRNFTEANVERQDYVAALGELLRRENAMNRDHSMKVETFRRSADLNWPVSRGYLFDVKSSFHR